MITVSLIGGLGNQMFQYAAGKALAERHGVALALDLSGFKDYSLRSFLLDRLLVPETIASSPQAKSAQKARSKFRACQVESTDRSFAWKGRHAEACAVAERVSRAAFSL